MDKVKVNNIIKMDDQYMELLNDLQKLRKSELIDLIHNYWVSLRSDAESKDCIIRMEQVNNIKILANIKAKYCDNSI
jgi:hypothetical protein